MVGGWGCGRGLVGGPPEELAEQVPGSVEPGVGFLWSGGLVFAGCFLGGVVFALSGFCGCSFLALRVFLEIRRVFFGGGVREDVFVCLGGCAAEVCWWRVGTTGLQVVDGAAVGRVVDHIAEWFLYYGGVGRWTVRWCDSVHHLDGGWLTCRKHCIQGQRLARDWLWYCLMMTQMAVAAWFR